MVSGASPETVPNAEPKAPAELEVLLRHQSLPFGRLGLCQMPEQELLADGRCGKPDPRFDCRIQIGIFRPKPSFPDVVLHRTSSEPS
jgi:hypothetical protein